jgi:ribosomal-protein-alanine N-acetyltransferase
MIKIEGEKIILREIDISDTDSITRYAADKEISMYTLIPYPYAKKDALDFLELIAEEKKENSSLHLGIEYNDHIIGMIGLNIINNQHKRAELGYWLGKDFWGMKIMSEAIGLFVPFCFEHANLERVYAYVEPENVSSWKLLESCGFQREGLLVKHFRKHDKQYDCYMYGYTNEMLIE